MPHDLFDNCRPLRKPLSTTPDAAPGECLDFGVFGCVRGERDRAIMLEIRHANGDITAMSYPLLQSAKFNPSAGIELNFSGTKVILIGCNLNTDVGARIRLFEALIRHRIVWIQEGDEARNQELNDNDVVIAEIQLVSPQEDLP